MKSDIEKEEPLKMRDKFRCKRCGEWKAQKEIREVVVVQKNRPLEFEHTQFTSQASVAVCGKCFQDISRS
jgi:hypothetical protein